MSSSFPVLLIEIFFMNIFTDKESGRDEKGRLFGNFIHLPHYTKMYDNLRSAYANYKVSVVKIEEI